MKARSVLTVSAILTAVCAGFGVSAAIQEDDSLIIKARFFMTSLEKGEFHEAVRDFDETMRKVSGPEKLDDFWKQLPTRFGAFKKQGVARLDRLGNYEIVLVTCDFEKVTLDARVVFDGEGRISGFQFVPSLPPAVYEIPDYANDSTFEEGSVTVTTGEWRLPGVLTLPRGRGPFPGLVLVHGSGPNDRDETLGPNKPFKDLAWGLATRGIAVLRYDKRTKVYAAKLAADRALISSFTVVGETIDDALSAVTLLKGEERVDGSRVFVLGHSLGGYLVPRMAAMGRDLGIRGFVIMAGLTRPLEDTILRQMRYLLSLDGSISGEDKKRLEDLQTETARIRTLGESDRDSGERFMNAGVRYWLDLRGYDPTAVVQTIEQPLLVLQGSRDYQVTTEDFENWKKVLEARPEAEFHLYPKLNHLFFAGQGLITPNEYVQVHGNVAQEVIEDIAAWIKKH